MKTTTSTSIPDLKILTAEAWNDYELLDSGNGARLERFGGITLVRPEAEAIWQPALHEKAWKAAQAVFRPGQEENGGHWETSKPLPERWQIQRGGLKFWLQPGGSKQVGIFPEQALQWDWIEAQVQAARRPIRVLNLFGYTGIASLAAARAGAQVTHLDASRKVMTWAHENQQLSGLPDTSIRWMLEDALKFVQREARRGSRYDGLILDPPKFGRGPQGEVWEFYKLLPSLLAACQQVISAEPRFVVLTAYAVKASALTLQAAMEDMMSGKHGAVEAGETALREQARGRLLSLALFARWAATD